MKKLPTGFKLVVLGILLILAELAAYQSIKQSTQSLLPELQMLAMTLYLICSMIWFALLFSFSSFRNATNATTLSNLGMVFLIAFFIFKIIIASFVLIDDIWEVICWLVSLYYGDTNSPVWVTNGMHSSDFLRKAGLLVGGTVFGTLFYGTINRHRYKIKRVPLTFDSLPASFHGYKVVQISDIHSGSFSSKKGVQRGVDMINALEADIVLFTGDIVNSKSDELLEYVNIFKQVKAKQGVYAIMGNHDYGDYTNWQSAHDKADDVQQLKDSYKTLGWHLLLDENISIEKNGERISIIGVENISASFKSYGSLSKAYAGTDNIPFKILMSHDPSHWDKEVIANYQDIDLTLSGHTHGFQFGIDLPKFKWSPAQFVYKQWTGLYKKDKQYLYVNQGFGFLGYPGRVGILPEITLIELRSN